MVYDIREMMLLVAPKSFDMKWYGWMYARPYNYIGHMFRKGYNYTTYNIVPKQNVLYSTIMGSVDTALFVDECLCRIAHSSAHMEEIAIGEIPPKKYPI